MAAGAPAITFSPDWKEEAKQTAYKGHASSQAFKHQRSSISACIFATPSSGVHAYPQRGLVKAALHSHRRCARPKPWSCLVFGERKGGYVGASGSLGHVRLRVSVPVPPPPGTPHSQLPPGTMQSWRGPLSALRGPRETLTHFPVQRAHHYLTFPPLTALTGTRPGAVAGPPGMPLPLNPGSASGEPKLVPGAAQPGSGPAT